jgi:putative addiction module component (TIGR02574 family)
MATDSEQVFSAALELGPDDQSRLLALLIQNLDPAREVGVQAAWEQEIDRRVGQLERGEVSTVTWDEVRSRLKGVGGS